MRFSRMNTVTSAALALTLAITLVVPALAQPGAQQGLVVQVPTGYTIEKVVDGLTFATGMTWDDQGRMYVAEAGGGFLEEAPPPRILRIEPGRATEVVNLNGKGVRDSVVGLTWHQGAFYITHRAEDFTGAVSRVTMDGMVAQVLSGITDSRSEHQVNDIKVGPDGRMYIGSGPAGNSGVIGIDLAPFVGLNPEIKTTPCRDYVLTGQNFMTPDFRTVDEPDTTMTGAFVPFGTATMPGQRIQGSNKCGGSILVFDPANAEATVRPYADGMRNVIGLAWNKQGEMFTAVNGYDIRGSRPVNDEWDPTYRVREGTWYGFPDFSAALEPLSDPKFDSPDSLQAPIVVNGQPQGKGLGFLIDHAASGLTPPDRGLVAGLHEFGSSPSLLDFAPDSWSDMAGRLFVAEFGDLSPATNPLRNANTGFQITYIDPATKRAVPFARNAKPGPASGQNAKGMGLERPFDVKFGPDGAMYISDYGSVLVNPADAEKGDDPYEFPPKTGAIWKVTRAVGAPPVTPPPPTQPAPPAAGAAPDMALSASLSGEAEVPNPGDPDGTGMAMVTLKAGMGEVCWDMMVSKITLPAAAAHIHEGEPGVAGPIVVPLSAPDANGAASGCRTVDAALLGRIGQNPGGFYVNVHTSDFPAGAVRGQLAMGTTPPASLPNTGVEGAPLNFPETGYSVSGEFLNYWRANGGLPVFGYPIDSERQVDGQVAQWFERNRFELHTENKAPYNVLLGRIGAEALDRQGVDWQSLPKADASAPHYFKETGQAIAPQFWNYYRSHGLEFGDRGVSAREALALFGYPISPARMETNAEGHTVLTQWFERARFEYHPNNAARYKVLLGRLGAQVRNERGR